MDRGNSNQDNKNYARPNQKWECGWTCDGWACRVGPSAKGECRATFECRPMLERKAGEEKGRWRCTRPSEHGGACETGPTPDGKCCKPIPKCQPKRSLRAKRALLCLLLVTFSFGMLMALGGSSKFRWKFLSPGQLSTAHQSEAFRLLEAEHFGDNKNGCAGCHGAARSDNPGWLQHALNSSPSPFNLKQAVMFDHRSLTKVDASCATCHSGHTFHQPNLTHDYSCAACHIEHRGTGRLSPPLDLHCVACHGDQQDMLAAADLGKKLSPEQFRFPQAGVLASFIPARPEEGYTQVIHAFHKDHPEFQVHRDNLKDTNPLRFNHAVHFGPGIPKLDGRNLDCASCHKPDASGTRFAPVKFEANCRSCHSLQFDPGNPTLQLPHGDTDAVRAFLRSLPRQYADLAARQGMTRKEDQDRFSQEQQKALKKLFPTGEDLERSVLLTGDRNSVAGGETVQRGYFVGCVYCHTPGVTAAGLPTMQKPVTPDRWMTHAKFNHQPHSFVACTECHAAKTSRETSDILLPKKDNCISCHSPKGGVPNSCVTCHGYHNTPGKP
jgi:hypothetical protein